MQTIKAVIFDWGGVLIEEPVPALMQYCADELNVSCDDYTKAHRKFADDFQLGKISEDVFFSAVCSYLNVPSPSVDCLWARAFEAAYQPKEDMFTFAGRLKDAGLSVALLSNTEPPAVEFFHKQKYDTFDVIVFSCLEGVTKPKRKIYELVLTRLGMAPSQSVFIDDKAECIDTAQQIGLHTILFSGTKQVMTELTRLGVKIDKGR